MSSEVTPQTPLSVEDVSRIVDEAFPEIHAVGKRMIIESVADRRARVRLQIDPRNLRHGGTVSGPTLFTIADFTIYVALIATLGRPAITSVTSNLSISFLLRPSPVDVVADAKLLRIGRRLAYAEVAVYSEDRVDMIAHATGSYSLATTE